MMTFVFAFVQKAAYEKQVEEEVQRAKEEAEHQKQLKEEEEKIQAAQEVRDERRMRGSD